jgi:hypothetical protein
VVASTVLLAGVLSGCTDHSPSYGTIDGDFVRSGGPAATPDVQLSGTITATPLTGGGMPVSVHVPASGKYSLRLRTGSYSVVGLSPQVVTGYQTDSAPLSCPGIMRTGPDKTESSVITVRANQSMTVDVVCNIP